MLWIFTEDRGHAPDHLSPFFTDFSNVLDFYIILAFLIGNGVRYEIVMSSCNQVVCFCYKMSSVVDLVHKGRLRQKEVLNFFASVVASGCLVG